MAFPIEPGGHVTCWARPGVSPAGPGAGPRAGPCCLSTSEQEAALGVSWLAEATGPRGSEPDFTGPSGLLDWIPHALCTLEKSRARHGPPWPVIGIPLWVHPLVPPELPGSLSPDPGPPFPQLQHLQGDALCPEPSVLRAEAEGGPQVLALSPGERRPPLCFLAFPCGPSSAWTMCWLRVDKRLQNAAGPRLP